MAKTKALHNFECNKGHQFEDYVDWDREVTKCPECKSRAERIWMAPRSPHRQLKDPIVLWRYPDGSLGVAGGADSKTPKSAERVEIRNLGEYRQHVKELNQQHRNREEAREERYQKGREAMEKERRSSIYNRMANESDPVARDLYREALERDKGGYQPLPFSEYFAEVAEMDSSNREGGRGQRK